jgi:hypothetical protein
MLQTAFDDEQGRTVRKAINHQGEAIYFDNREYFAGSDASERLGVISKRFREEILNKT